MNEFNGFLMPFSFLRRWSYNELIPALLYFDRVTFLMDDIEPQYVSEKYQKSGAPSVRLRSPEELAGMDPQEFVDGLTVEQHRYYWPMRDLMKAEVIAISSDDLGPFLGPEPRNQLQTLLDQKSGLAVEYETYASSFYDAFTPAERHNISSFEKAMEVYSWIKHALSRRQGWQRVTLHPNGYRALLSALSVFPDLLQLFRTGDVDTAGKANQPQAQSYLAMRVVGSLLNEKLNTFSLQSDPNALSEILEVRQRYGSDLRRFRAKMAEATNEWEFQDNDFRNIPGRIETYIQTVLPEFEEARRALADDMRIPKLTLRKAGAIILIGACAGIGTIGGTLVAGPLGSVAGATVGTAAAEAIKAWFSELGKEVAGKIRPQDTPVDKSLVYLFHAEQALT